ncbi:MAG: AarF/ABC1/UbiB kinase family protein, partial [Gammaproteobacteria bacterium]|nr:AarF/ABC1/UbiB kinase family protein [Gammaproteobacteria bacterium]
MAGMRSVGRLAASRLRGRSGDQSWTDVGEDWFRTLSEMKGAAMKLGQLASQYADVLPPGLAGPLARLQRDAEARPYAEMKQVLDAQWSAPQWAMVRPL